MAGSMIDTKVAHETFGPGMVLAEEDREGREPLVRIAFENDERPWRQFLKKDVLAKDGPFRSKK